MIVSKPYKDRLMAYRKFISSFGTDGTRLAASITVAPLLLIFMFAVLSLEYTSNTIVKIIASGLENKSALVAHDINGFIRERIIDAKILSQADVLESGDISNATQYLEEIVAINRWVNHVDVVDIDGNIRATGSGEGSEIGSGVQNHAPKLISTTDFLLFAKPGDVFVSGVRLLEAGPVLSLMTPITDDSNAAVIGALFFEIDLKNTSRIASLLDDGAGEHIYIVDANRRVIASNDSEVEVSSLFSSVSEQPAFLADVLSLEQSGNGIYRDRNDNEVIAGYTRTDTLGVNDALDWRVIATAPLKKSTEPIAEAELLLFGLVVIIGVMVVFLAFFLLGNLQKRLHEIVTVANAISSGDYSKRLILTGKSTVLQRLATAFNHMAETVEASIKELLQREKTISHQVLYDNLTDLPKRHLILDRLSQIIDDAARDQLLVAVMFLNIDNFKKVNGTLGRDCGDQVIVEISKRLRNIVREDGSVGHLGGDEFVIVLKGVEIPLDIKAIADNILFGVGESFVINSRELLMTVSVGIAIYPDNGAEPSELVKYADSAMHHAKGLGRNTASYFTEELNYSMTRLTAIEEQLKGALERNEFEIYYQPKAEICSGKIVGAEALLRWNNPSLGSVSPVEFIPVAEQTGLIIPIGEFVFNSAFEAAKQWVNEFDKSFSIAVNLSPRQFKDAELVTSIKAAMERVDISPSCVEMEITEGILMGDHAYINDALAGLDALGIKISLDDFGTGYSSLSYLRKYPFDILKIDRSFISDITTNSADRELTNAAIAMAHSLNLKVVAEGIETKDQLNLLKAMNCEFGQGYLFSKPVPEDQMTNILTIAVGQHSVLK